MDRDAPPFVPMRWLDGVPATTTGAAWGVPWPRGSVRRPDEFGLATPAGAPIPVQSWPMAYWPDGSLKWTGHAVGADAALEQDMRLAANRTAAQPQAPVTATTEDGGIVLTNGVVTVHLASTGPVVLRQLSRDGRAAARDGQLVLRLQDRPEEDRAGAKETTAYGMVTSAVIEQSGPVAGGSAARG